MTYLFKTKVGTFLIVPKKKRFHVMFGDEDLGSYATAQQAAEDVAGGHTFLTSKGTDTSKLGIPDDVSEWQQH